MTLQVFAVMDTKLSAFATPFFAPTFGVAVRLFGDLVLDPGSNVHRHPDDFRLFHLGEFDQETGRFKSPEAPGFITGAGELFKVVPSKQTEEE